MARRSSLPRLATGDLVLVAGALQLRVRFCLREFDAGNASGSYGALRRLAKSVFSTVNDWHRTPGITKATPAPVEGRSR